MKRLHDTEIWDKHWFMEFSPVDKCAILYIKDKCDNVGVWKPNFPLAEAQIGGQPNWDNIRDCCNNNIEVLPSGKWFIPDFMDFQHGDFFYNSSNHAHQSYEKLLHKHGLYERFRPLKDPSKGSPKGSPVGSSVTPKARERVKERVRARVILEYLNKKTGRRFREVDSTLAPIMARLKEGFTESECRLVIDDRWGRWGHDERMEEYCRPATIFGKEKFPGYLAEAQKYQPAAVGNCPECGKSLENEMRNGVSRCYRCDTDIGQPAGKGADGDE